MLRTQLKIRLMPVLAVMVIWVAASLSGPSAWAGDVALGAAETGGGSLRVGIKSFQELKFQDTIHQKYDYSCGSAALATLLTYTYGIPVTEKTVFRGMFDHADQARVKKYGFSLLDMKEYLARHHLLSGGFKASLSKLAAARVPAIVLINHRGYNHFVVIRGIRRGRVLLSDPSLGTRAISVVNFTKEWNGIFFVVLTNIHVAQQAFNNPKAWAVAPQSPKQLARFQIEMMNPALLGWRNANLF